MNPINSKIPTEIRDRVISAANDLYQQSNYEKIPTVDQVRRESRVDMNAASCVMKEWRDSLTLKSRHTEIAIPEALLQMMNSTVAPIWQYATELAHQSLHKAQAEWEAERQRDEAIRIELSDTCDLQTEELESVKSQLDISRQEHSEAILSIEALRANEQTLSEKIAVLTTRLEGAIKSFNSLNKEKAAAIEEAKQSANEAAELRGKLSALINTTP